MHIRTFRAASLQEALVEIREQMGPEATVLHTRQSSGLLGWLGRRQVEVTAGLRDEPPTRSTTIASSAAEPSSSPSVAPVDSAGLMRSVAELTALVQQLRQAYAPNEHPLAASLQAAGMDVASSQQMLRLVQARYREPLGDDLESLWPTLLDVAASTLRVGKPIRAQRGRRRTVALVGPTGVGKTTTIAKLAAGYRLQTGLQVGLVTIDTFRTGAVEQLRSYANIMELPMRVVQKAEEMHAALEQLAHCELILIDTAGRSPRDQVHVQQLDDLLGAAAPDEVHLVLSATTAPEAARRVIHGFGQLDPTAMILSKVDEVNHAAGLLPILSSAAPPLSYMTTGQAVPDDIQRIDPLELCNRLIPLPELAGATRGILV